jgi:hypothetical protein
MSGVQNMKLAVSLLKPQIGPTVVVKQTDDYVVEDFSPETASPIAGLSRTGSFQNILAAMSRSGSQKNLNRSGSASPPRQRELVGALKKESKGILPYGSEASLGFESASENTATGAPPENAQGQPGQGQGQGWMQRSEEHGWTPRKLERQISDLEADIEQLKVLA